ncbi:MAG: class I adenylate-forming enzyme family protein [Verrucomicrobiota bacterium]
MDSGLYHCLDEQAASRPNEIYLYYQEETVTFSQARDRTDKLGAALIRSGIKPGDRVAMMMPNRPELVFAYFACWRIGAIAVPLNTRYQRREVSYVLEHSGAIALIVSEDYFNLVEPLCRKGDLHDHTIIVDGKKANIAHWIDFQDFMEDSNEPVDWPTVEPDMLAIMLHTSGSTANPKGVMHSHRSLFHIAELCGKTLINDQCKVSAVYLSILYIGGLTLQLLRNTLFGRACALLPNRQPDEFIEALKKFPITDATLMPTDIIFVLEHPEAEALDWSSIYTITTGGDKPSSDVHANLKRITGIDALEMYGMTEIGLVTSNDLDGPKVIGSMGKVIEPVQLEVRDANNAVVPTNEIGELWVKSPGNMMFYWNNPQATKETMVDGWIKTGDLVRCDENGYYWFEGRSKLIIVRSGSNIAPQEVEDVIDHNPAVLCSCVVGVPDPKWGERVRAYVELNHEYEPTPTEAELIEYARHHIARYKAPEEIVFLDAMPTNSSGKLDRAKLRRMASES